MPCHHLATSPLQVTRKSKEKDTWCIALPAACLQAVPLVVVSTKYPRTDQAEPLPLTLLSLCTFSSAHTLCPPSFLLATSLSLPLWLLTLLWLLLCSYPSPRYIFPLFFFVLSHDQLSPSAPVLFYFLILLFFLILSTSSPIHSHNPVLSFTWINRSLSPCRVSNIFLLLVPWLFLWSSLK